MAKKSKFKWLLLVFAVFACGLTLYWGYLAALQVFR